MPKMRGFMRSKPKIDDAEWAIAQMRTAARLGDLFRSDEPSSGKDTDARDAENGAEAAANPAPVTNGPGPWPGGPRPPIIVVGVSDVVSVLPQDGAVKPPVVPPEADALVEASVGAAPPVDVTPAAEADGTEVMVEEPDAGRAGPIGVMARSDEVVGDDSWRLPRVEVPVPPSGRATQPDAGWPAAAHVFPKAPPRPEGADATPGPFAASTPIEAASTAGRPPVAASSTVGRTTRKRPEAARTKTDQVTVMGPLAKRAIVMRARSAPAPAARQSRVARPATGAESVDRASEPAAPPARQARRALAPRPAAKPRPVVAARPATTAEPAATAQPETQTVPAAKAMPAAKTAPAAKQALQAKARPAVKARSVPAPVPAAYCPYCAKLLEPAPTASRRCERCRQRIVVKRIDGTAVYLTEAAVLVFEAERRRVMASVRWARDRDRWLQHAAAAGAPAERMAQLTVARLTEDLVNAARKLYLSTVDRAFRTARSEGDWDEASRLRRDQAAVLYRIAGSPAQPPVEVVAIFRQGVAAELRGVSAIARNAELVSARCCDACRGDDRLVVRITKELSSPRLPHAGCPRGLCRCHWDLATRDRLTMRRYLRRRPAAQLRLAQIPEDNPQPSATAAAADDRVG